MKEELFPKLGRALWNFLVFFLLMAFVITCCMLLFLNSMSRVAGMDLSQFHVEAAAQVTFFNVVFLSLVCTVIDWLRRKWMVDRPVKQILKVAQQITAGDFTARVPRFRSLETGDGFGEIAACLNKMAQELAGTETLRTDFIANVSHELKTPLAVMQNYGTMLQQPGLSEEKRVEYAKAITDASRRLADMVSNILRLNKLENQTVYPHTTTYDLGGQLCECLLAYEDVWEKKELDIQTNVDECSLGRYDWLYGVSGQGRFLSRTAHLCDGSLYLLHYHRRSCKCSSLPQEQKSHFVGGKGN